MIPVKIECECGQHYAFDVEPISGRMPAPVACPACGMDGTEKANSVLAESAPAPTLNVQEQGGAGLAHELEAHSTKPALAPRPTTHRLVPHIPGQPTRTQAMFEARAKVSWGDPPKDVLKYLMIQGFSYQEASEAVNELFEERAAIIRGNGIKYIIGGAAVACIPIATWLVFLSVGYIFVRTFLVTIFIGLCGLWMLVKGLFMLLAPKSQPGDVAEQ